MTVVFVPRSRLPFLHRWRKVVQGKVSVDREGVHVDGRQVIHRGEIHGASLRQTPNFWLADVWSRSGGYVTVVVRDKDAGLELIRALKIDAASRTANFHLATPGAMQRILTSFAILPLSFVVSFLLKHEGLKLLGFFFPLAAMIVMVVVTWLNLVKVTAGADGLVVRQGFRRRFIPHDQIVDVGPDGADLVVKLHDGELRFPMTLRRNATGKALEEGIANARAIAKRIDEARAVYAELGGDPTSIPALARAGMTTSDWLDALRRIGKDIDAGFRHGVIGRERLWMLVESTQVPPAYRISAAVALRVSDDDSSTGVRLRQIAEACASPDLEKRLRIAASASEEELEALLDETDVSASRSSGS